MRKSIFTLALLGAALPAALADVQPAEKTGLPGAIPDSVGRAGMAAVALPAEGAPAILITGGANFPNAIPGAKTPAERGAKVFYDDLAICLPGTGAFAPVGKLPAPIGYAAFAAWEESMIIAGGCNDSGHLDQVTSTKLIKGQGGAYTTETSVLPPLPVTTAYPAFAVVGSNLYVMGGQEKADSVTCLSRCFVLDLTAPTRGWKELRRMPEARMLAAAGAIGGKIYVTGGCSLHPDSKGAAERTYLHSVMCYDTVTDTWSTVPAPMPEPLVGAANPLPSHGGLLYVYCGDPGNFYRASLSGHAPEVHPGQNGTIYSFNPRTCTWTKENTANAARVATCPAVQLGSEVHIISGETHPGVRTPVISSTTIKD